MYLSAFVIPSMDIKFPYHVKRTLPILPYLAVGTTVGKIVKPFFFYLIIQIYSRCSKLFPDSGLYTYGKI